MILAMLPNTLKVQPYSISPCSFREGRRLGIEKDSECFGERGRRNRKSRRKGREGEGEENKEKENENIGRGEGVRAEGRE